MNWGGGGQGACSKGGGPVGNPPPPPHTLSVEMVERRKKGERREVCEILLKSGTQLSILREGCYLRPAPHSIQKKQNTPLGRVEFESLGEHSRSVAI